MHGLIYWIVVGLIAGWLAGRVMKGGGYGILIDIVLGILGGVLGGWLFGILGISAGGGVIVVVFDDEVARLCRELFKLANGLRGGFNVILFDLDADLIAPY